MRLAGCPSGAVLAQPLANLGPIDAERRKQDLDGER
jgi:hypothetical protein